jgi:hypothetical protein
MNNLITKTAKISSLLILSAGLLSSCKKDKDPVEEPSDFYYKLERVENFTSAVEKAPAFYFSFNTKKEVAATQVKTTEWDMAFGGTLTCFISGNSGADAANYGVESNAVGGIAIVEKPFDQVTDIPAATEFKTGKNVFGLDKEGGRATETGWLLYDETGLIKGDGSALKKHVAYGMPEKRTLVIRTAKGDYAKIKMISLYKDAFTADKMFLNTPSAFFTFEYVVVPKGSTKFQIK